MIKKINNNSLKATLVWFIASLFFLYEFFIRTVIGAYQGNLMFDLHLNRFQFSLLSTTLFFIIYGVMQIPVGIILDRIGLKKSMLLGLLLCALSSLFFAHSHHFFTSIFLRGVMGLGASFGFICLLVTIHEWMPLRYTAIFIGVSQFIGTIGAMVSGGPLETIAATGQLSWRRVFFILSLIGFFIAILVFLFVENNPEKQGGYQILKCPQAMKASLKRLFCRSQPWIVASLSATLYFTIEYFSENEGRSFLHLKGLSLTTASYMLTLSWLAYAIGCPLWGVISDYTQKRRPSIVLSAFLGFLGIVLILYASGMMALSFGFVLLGLSASGQSIGFATIAEQFSEDLVAIGFGLNNGMIIIASAINAPLLGFLIDTISHKKSPTLPIYQEAFLFLIFLALLSVILSVGFLQETYCKSTVALTYLKIQKKEA